MNVKPFLKWAGGKRQLLSEIDKMIPFSKSSEFVYIEPFVGGGAVLFWMLRHYPNIKKAVINDLNSDLICCYRVIRENVDDLIFVLSQWQREFYSLSQEEKKNFYYQKRDRFNKRNESDPILQSALLIFLNRTCFNGLYRVNQKNIFNVPMGNYKKPKICDEKNLRRVSRILQNVVILEGDFEQTLQYAEKETLFYLDPPYKPLSETSAFNNYAKTVFDDQEQIRLANFCKKIDSHGYHWILSNSDTGDRFFDDLYSDFYRKRVFARRRINSDPKKRGDLTELLISNKLREKSL